MEDFHRIRRLPPYVFEEVNRLKALARTAGEDIIDFGMGNPDLPTPDFVVDKLNETLGEPRTDRYLASRGIKGLRKAHVAYYKRRFGVKLDPDRDDRGAGLQGRFRQPRPSDHRTGRCGAVPDPAYPIHAFGFIIAGAVIRHVPAPSRNIFQASAAPRHSVRALLVLEVSYPSNPTAQVVVWSSIRRR